MAGRGSGKEICQTIRAIFVEECTRARFYGMMREAVSPGELAEVKRALLQWRLATLALTFRAGGRLSGSLVPVGTAPGDDGQQLQDLLREVEAMKRVHGA